MYHRRGGVRVKGKFLFCVFGRNSYLNAIWITCFTILKRFKATKFLKFESPWKKFNCSNLPLRTSW